MIDFIFYLISENAESLLGGTFLLCLFVVAVYVYRFFILIKGLKIADKKGKNGKLWFFIILIAELAFGLGFIPFIYIATCKSELKPPQKWLCSKCGEGNEPTATRCAKCNTPRFFKANKE
jgi:ribosomal protein L40E